MVIFEQSHDHLDFQAEIEGNIRTFLICDFWKTNCLVLMKLVHMDFPTQGIPINVVHVRVFRKTLRGRNMLVNAVMVSLGFSQRAALDGRDQS